MLRCLRMPLLLLCAALAVPAAAEEVEGEDDAPHFRATSWTIGEGTRPTALDPVQGLHAAALGESVGFWAESFGYAIDRRQSLYDLEGGASWRLDESWHVTASYRVLGIDLGYDSDLEGADFEPGIAALFLGLAFGF